MGTNSVVSTELTLLTINDIYDIESDSGNGGLSQVMTLLNKEREIAKNHITTVNGDFLVASSIANIVYGSHMVDLFNLMGVDFVVAGNHEFDFGPDKLKQRIKDSNFKWLGTNVLERTQPDGRVFEGMDRTHIINVDGFKIGIFGVTTHECRILSHPGDDVLFSSVIETSKEAVESLKKEGCDAIIALTHQSFAEDVDLAAKVPSIDVILGGHDHHPATIVESNTLIHKSGQNANYLGVIKILLERDASTNKVRVYHSWKMVLNRNTPRDPVVGERVNQYQSQLYSLKEVPLGLLKSTLDSRTEKVRASETSMGNLVSDALRHFFGAEVAVVQSGSIRGDSVYPPDTVITQFDIVRESPFPNMASLIKIRGRDLKEALEQGVRKLPARAGCFPQISGIKMKVDVSKTPGQRIVEIHINSEPLDENRVYLCALTEFIRNGGDGYLAFTKSDIVKQRVMLLSSVISNYVKECKEIFPVKEGRIIIL